MKKFVPSLGLAAFPWKLCLWLAVAAPWAETGLAQVSFSGHPGTDPAVRVAPRVTAPSEAEPTPVPIPRPAAIFPDWNLFPDGVETDADPANRPLAPNSATPPEPLRLGDVTFNRMAESVNAWKPAVATANDLSRSFQPGAAAPGLLGAIPAGAWLLTGIAAVALLLGLVLGQYEKDREERRRQKRRKHHRHRHRKSEHGQGPPLAG